MLLEVLAIGSVVVSTVLNPLAAIGYLAVESLAA